MATGRLLDLVREHRDEVQAAVERHRGVSFTVFGSAARGEDTDASDIDLLVRFSPESSLFDLLHLSDELERILGRRVDGLPGRAQGARRAHPSRGSPGVSRSDDLRLLDILEASEQLGRIVARGRDAFREDEADRTGRLSGAWSTSRWAGAEFTVS